MIEPPRGRAGSLLVGAILVALLALPGASRAGCIDLNAASLDELARLQHVGEGRAAAIVEGRPWVHVRDLTRVHGLGAGRVLDIEAQGLACVDGVVAAAERPRIVGRAHVLDGDTIEVAGERIRLIGIDSPEEGQHCTAAGRPWRCGDEATAYLAGLAGGREVACEVYGRDRWQRALAVCWLGNLDLNGEMVRQGWALAWYPSSGAVLGPDYDGLQAGARRARAGMWRGEFSRGGGGRASGSEQLRSIALSGRHGHGRDAPGRGEGRPHGQGRVRPEAEMTTARRSSQICR